MKNKHLKRTASLAAAAALICTQNSVGFALDTLSSKEYSEDEIVRVIVKLKDEPVMASDKACEMGADYLETREALAAQKKLLETQEKAESCVKELYPDMTVGISYTTLMNGFSCDIPFELIDDVEALAWVDSVHISRSHMVEHMYSAGDSCGVSEFKNDTGLTGEGEVIAVIDSELDITHDMFAPIDDKKVRLKKSDIQKVKDSGAGFNTEFEVDVDKAYVSSKVPFAVCYNPDHDPYEVADEEQYHGTHVSGIAAGNEITDHAGEKISGIAPDAQIVFMSCKDVDENGYDIINDEYAVAAIEDAVKLNVTSINLSFGMDTEYENDLYNDIIDRVEDAGIVLCAAAGNDSSLRNYPEYPDTSTLNSPASFKSAFAVAAAKNTQQRIGVMTLDGSDEEIEYCDGFSTRLSETAGGLTVEYVFCGGGSDEEVAGKDVSGKLILLDSVMGTESFAETGKRLAETGALGVISIDMVEGELHDIFADGLPYVNISRADGQKLLNAENKKVFVSPSGKLIDAESGICAFSSKGVCQDLELKPDITGIGGDVASAGYNNSIEYLSGTSMATPYIAGCSALVSQYVSKNMPEFKGAEKAKLIRNILMNTAKPMKNDYGLVSPRDQGAGLADLSAVSEAKVLMTAADGFAKVSLRDGLSDTFTFEVKVKNYSNEAVSFTNASLDLVTDSYDEAPNGIKTISETQKLNAAVSGMDALKTLKAGEEKTAKLTVKLDSTQVSALKKDFKNGFFVEGYLSLSGAGNSSDISIPVLGYYGSWGDLPIFDKAWTEQGSVCGYNYFETSIGVYDSIPLDVSFSKLAQLYGKYGFDDGYYELSEDNIETREDYFRYILSQYYRMSFVNATDEDLKDIFNDEICISPNNDGWGDDILYNMVALREAKVQGLDIFDNKDKLVIGTFSSELEVNPLFESSFYANNLDTLSEGKYKAVISGYINYEGAKTQTVSQVFEVDNVPPQLGDIKVEEKNGRKILSFKATDKHLDGIYVLGKGTGGEYGKFDPSKGNDGYDIDTFRMMMEDFTHYHFHDEEEMETTVSSTVNTTLFNNFITAKEPEEMELNDADFLDIIHCEPDKNGSFSFKYDITDLDEYSVCVMDTAYNMSDYGYEVPYVGNIAELGEVSPGSVLKLKAPQVISNVPIKEQGWKISYDGQYWMDYDTEMTVSESMNMAYICYFADTGKFTTISNSVLVKIKGMDGANYILLVTGSDGTRYEFSTRHTDFQFRGALPEGDYKITVNKTGYVPKAFSMHIDESDPVIDIRLAKLGDVDISSNVDIEDAVAVIANINGIKPLDDYGLAVADTDLSGSVDIEDAVVIINHINGVNAIPDYIG